ncbi:hypothetical protein AK812_SmicGene26878 [Symbiodinium microadriaticum]|uniref:Uncharacterized protein n=1 Tax=Symbiodinium microadriaticum TaxID=2951 RepID=A0A1Q9D8I5_SYMMI|nr:hypothetical protein AK812_SmicGene26878 [Symbiodinium microadriaticum]
MDGDEIRRWDDSASTADLEGPNMIAIYIPLHHDIKIFSTDKMEIYRSWMTACWAVALDVEAGCHMDRIIR